MPAEQSIIGLLLGSFALLYLYHGLRRYLAGNAMRQSGAGLIRPRLNRRQHQAQPRQSAPDLPGGGPAPMARHPKRPTLKFVPGETLSKVLKS